MTMLAIKEIDIDPTVQIRQSNHEPTIQRYMDAWGKLPPVMVFKTQEGYLLADGFHRIAAAERLGKRQIDATVRKGTRNDALEFAVIANTKNGEPLSKPERDEGVRRLRHLHPKWSNREVAEAMSIDEDAVQRVRRADDIKKGIFAAVSSRVTDSHYLELGPAPKEHREELVRAADERGWTVQETRQAVQNIRDPRFPASEKRALLAGKTDPKVKLPDGEYAFLPETVGRTVRQMQEGDPLGALERALTELARLRRFKPNAVIDEMDPERLADFIKEAPEDVAYLEELLAAAEKRRRKLEVVS